VNPDVERLMDRTSWRILEELQADGRLSMRELGARVGLTAPAVAERVQRLRSAGAIRGFSVQLDRRALGDDVLAFVRLSTRARDFGRTAAGLPGVIECHRLTGTDAFLLKVSLPSIRHLEDLIDTLMAYGDPTSSIVLSTAVAENPMRAPDTRA
jgi:Lrp/AsnC family leucine-responsive transcriptional regulator